MRKINFKIIHIIYSLVLMILLLSNHNGNMSTFGKIGITVFLFILSMMFRYIFPMIATDYDFLGNIKLRDTNNFIGIMEAIKIISLVFLGVSIFIALLGVLYLLLIEKTNSIIVIWMILPIWFSIYKGAKETINTLSIDNDILN